MAFIYIIKITLESYFNNVNDLPFSLKYCRFPQCQTNPYFNRSSHVHLKLNRYDLQKCVVGFLFPSNFKELKHNEHISVCKCAKDNVFEIICLQ